MISTSWSSLRSLIQRSLTALALGALASAGDLIVVDVQGTADFDNIQDAVTVSQAGDLILVLSGEYDGFTVVGKSIHITAVDGGVVTLRGTLHVRGIAEGSILTLRGLRTLGGSLGAGSPVEGFSARNSPGAIRVMDCQFEGFFSAGFVQGAAARVEQCANLTLSNCTLLAPFSASGLYAVASNLALSSCSVQGGLSDGQGGIGVELAGSVGQFFATGTTIRGGSGFDGSCPEFGSQESPADGADGLVNSGWNAWALDSTILGGTGGFADCSFSWCICLDGADGQPVVGPLTLVPGSGRTLDVLAVLEGPVGSLPLTFHGEAGDRVYLQASFGADFLVNSRQVGPRLIASPFLGSLRSTTGGTGHLGGGLPLGIESPFMGVIGPQGVLSVQVPIVPGQSAGNVQSVQLQALLSDSSGTFWATDARTLSITPCSNAMDCNENGIGDACDVSTGASLDCNGNGVPDECEWDCNQNGVPDGCDLLSGSSQDQNANNVPDECEGALRLHVNGIAAPGGDGLTWATAFDNLQTALLLQREHRIEVEEIWVAEGVYRPTARMDREATFAPGNGALLRGGFAGNETVLAQRNLTLHPTTLSGDLLGNDNFPAGMQENSRHVLSLFHPSDGVHVDGFTISGGFADAGNEMAGGIYVLGSLDFHISRCTIEHNRAVAGAGVGIVFDVPGSGTSPTGDFQNCTIQDNRADINAGFNQGGGLQVFQSGLIRFLNCEITKNTALWSAGAAYIGQEGTVQFLDCTVWNNASSLTNGGGGMYTFGFDASTVLRSCVVWGNTLGSNQGQLDGDLTEYTVSFSCIEGSPVFPGTGNIKADPLFVDSLASDLRLAAGSPCIDAGENSSLFAQDLCDLDQDGIIAEETPVDLGGVTRRLDDPATPDTGLGVAPVIDMGAHEHDPSQP